ncbi:MAG: thioredoxin-dependent thiol peroxidase [Candidatus Omnitrophica bacterium]|nr:thioredoxin-dependent thiol peroxidase [Candidatus Omnitrophota bacterium]
MAKELKEGDLAPDFKVRSTEGKEIALKDFRGKHVILYFYPKDDTPGCTREACDFRDNLRRILAKEAVVLGVSHDSLESHDKFRDKYNLPFTLLSDPEKKMTSAYGVYKEKSLYGKLFMGIERTTFVIGKDGKIRKIFPKVKVDGHIEEILQTLG